MHRISDLVVLILFVPALSGCFGPVDDTDPVAVPHLGLRATYSYVGGGVLHLSIGNGSVEIRDHFGKLQDAIPIRYRIISSDTDEVPFNTTEYVSKLDGSIIRQDVDCDIAGYWPDRDCDPSYSTTLFAPVGHPGAMGIAPLWASRTNVAKVASGEHMDHAVGLQSNPVPPANWVTVPGRSECHLREPANNATWDTYGAWMPVTAISTSLEVCADVPVPVGFVSDMAFPPGFGPDARGVFRLLEWQDGDGDLWPEGLNDVRPPRFTVQPPMSASTALLGQETAYLNFTSMEAHKKLLEENESYERLVSMPGSRIVSISHLGASFGSSVNGVRLTEGHKWTFVVTTTDGEYHRFRAEKTESYSPVGTKVKEDVRSVDYSTDDVGPVVELPVQAPAITLNGAIAYGVGLLGCDEPPGAQWASRLDSEGITGTWPVAEDGRLIARISRTPENPAAIVKPYAFVLDGSTGGVFEILGQPSHIERFDQDGLQKGPSCPPEP